MTQKSLKWPDRPYRGLDFYREIDAPLFREREIDATTCKDLLLSFGVKLLLLQGSSGCGKSSFLRAGLIPSLRTKLDAGNNTPLETNVAGGSNTSRQVYFLSGRDIVIRCTADPLKEIAKSIHVALKSSTTFIAGSFAGAESDTQLDEAERERLRSTVGGIIDAPDTSEQTAAQLTETLLELVADLPGQLILILDQAEEVLTRDASHAASQAFFRFLEGVYLRNIDLRVVVSLRTEYYGRFRDELRISDDRLAKRPKSGGVHSYLLRLLRDKASLIRIIEAPTSAKDNGRSVYEFSYAPGLVEKIVDDLLEYFTHSSVTPALQVVCDSLYDSLTERKRTINHDDYRKPGDIGGILSDYVVRGIRKIGANHSAEIDKWRATLYTLVSRQGGGTVVSLTETVDDLEAKARSNKVKGDVRKAFLDLAVGSTPLLRGEPPENPKDLSLKHDVLAVVLSRWYDEYGGAIKAQQEDRKRLWLVGGVGGSSVVAALAVIFVIFQAATTFQEKARLIKLRSDYVASDTTDFGNDALLTLVSLDEIQQWNYWYGALTGQAKTIEENLIAQLRDVLQRAPRYFGRYKSAAFDPNGHSVAFLGSDGIEIVRLDDNFDALLSPHRDLPHDVIQSPTATVGFMTGLGAVIYSDGQLYWWEDNNLKNTDLRSRLPTTSVPKIRSAQFTAGWLYVFLSEGNKITSVIPVRSNDLSSQEKLNEEPIVVAERPPVFSNRAAGLYAFLDVKANDETNGAGKQLQLSLRDFMNPNFQRNVKVASNSAVVNRGETLAFAANENAVLIRDGSGTFYLAGGSGVEEVERFGQDAGITPIVFGQIYPALAAVRTGGNWRVAWPSFDGIVVVEGTRGSAPLKPIFGKPLMGATPMPSGVQFSVDGDFVLDSPTVGIPSFFVGFDITEVWDLRLQRRNWLERSNLAALRREACRIANRVERRSAFSKKQEMMFLIDARQQPCESSPEALP
jgi:hypothetical protein